MMAMMGPIARIRKAEAARDIRSANITRLYNVVRDPFEAHDLSNHPEEQTRLKALTAILDDRRRP